MVRLSRIVLISAGIVSMLLCGGLFVRQVVLQADPGLNLSLPSWWDWLVSPEHPARAGVAAALCGLAALLCLWLAVAVARPHGTPVRRLDVAFAPGGSTSMEPDALDGLLAGGLRVRLPEVISARAQLFRGKTGYDAAVAVTARPCDVADLHARVFQAVREDLLAATGVTVTGLDLEIDRFVLEDRGES